MMSSPNTLFLLAKWGLLKGKEEVTLESHMWLLDDFESSMQFVSLHKSKSERSTKCGEIVCIRDATDAEVEAHQKRYKDQTGETMKIIDQRKIIVFRPFLNKQMLWPKSAVSHQMAYKGTAFINWL